MQFEKTKKMFEYWQNVKGPRKAPARNEIEPSDIRSLLGDTFILEINHQIKYVIYRLAGTRLCEAYGCELKGQGFLVPWAEQDNLKILNALANTYADYTPNCINYLGHNAKGHSINFETLLLPLLPIGDGTSRIIGITSPAKIPYWHGSEPVITNQLRAIFQHHQNNHASTARNFQSDNGSHDIRVPYLKPPALFESALIPGTIRDSQKFRTVKHLTVLDGGKS